MAQGWAPLARLDRRTRRKAVEGHPAVMPHDRQIAGHRGPEHTALGRQGL